MLPGRYRHVIMVIVMAMNSVITPHDFDISPYFSVIKPIIEAGFDYRTLTWAEERMLDQIGHAKMPDIRLSRSEIAGIVAYIGSLDREASLRLVMALNVNADMSCLRQLSGAIQKTNARREPFAG